MEDVVQAVPECPAEIHAVGVARQLEGREAAVERLLAGERLRVTFAAPPFVLI